MERGWPSRVAHASGALSASHRGPSATFARTEEAKEAHDSIVSRTQCRRSRRGPGPGFALHAAARTLDGRPRRPPLRSLRDCFVPRGQAARSPSLDEFPRNDDRGSLAELLRCPRSMSFLAMTTWGFPLQSRSLIREPTRNDVVWCGTGSTTLVVAPRVTAGTCG